MLKGQAEVSPELSRIMVYITPITYVLIIPIILILNLIRGLKLYIKDYTYKELPTPSFRLPIFGHLYLLGGYEVPYQAFTDLGKKYGQLVKLKLGSVDALVVNGTEFIKKVTKGNDFDSRPNFERYRQLFSGNKDNSLAFCDYSDKQKIRRKMLTTHAFPTYHKYHSLVDIILDNTSNLVNEIETDKAFAIKNVILRTCANIFTKHFCSKTFSLGDAKHQVMIEDFDEIFYEVNQGYLADFLPSLLPLHRNNLKRMNFLTRRIRSFILDEIIGDRYQTFEGIATGEPVDYVEALIKHVKNGEEGGINWDTALFALEDIIGGHSAVGNFVTKVLGYLVKEPEVISKMREEIDDCTRINKEYRPVSIYDNKYMPYTEAAIKEAIRLIASPIVPRVANRDTVFGEYVVKKDTLIFLNNYEESMSEKLWTDPQTFNPERFIKDGAFVTPPHFRPFGGGKRLCMGYKMVELTSFAIIGTLVQNFDILPVDNEEYKVPVGSLALPKSTYKFNFKKRSR